MNAREKVEALSNTQRSRFARFRDGMAISGNDRIWLVKRGLAVRDAEGKCLPDPAVLAVFNARYGVMRQIKAPASWPFPGPGSPAFVRGTGVKA